MADRIIEAMFVVGALAALLSFLSAGAAVVTVADPAEMEHAVNWFGLGMFAGLGLVMAAFVLELIKDAVLAEREHQSIPVTDQEVNDA